MNSMDNAEKWTKKGRSPLRGTGLLNDLSLVDQTSEP